MILVEKLSDKVRQGGEWRIKYVALYTLVYVNMKFSLFSAVNPK